ncbi:MAG: GDYXXLXY domain-containing protein [Verrucomicrobiales bacterium]|nr:GDYXXLXY domain-containing protein [Verrucomicrobiales bacterium]
MKRSVIIGLGLAIAMQVVVVAGMLGNAALPLWLGKEIRVKTVPRDPRSLFRGNYARLDYEIGRLHKDELKAGVSFRSGEVVYVSLQKDENGIYGYKAVSSERPDEGVFLRGRVERHYNDLEIEYGIEAFFAPKEKALKLERDLSKGGVAILMVMDNGRVALKDVVAPSQYKKTKL